MKNLIEIEIVIIKRSKQILVLKNSVNEMINTIGEHSQQNGPNRKRICVMKDRNFEIIYSEE